ncbi:MAG: hypothetical protein C4583_11205 [Anaerolineaceae bacterium]|nr:MAG: hypothetical protein C4583_11205 [Anaerolineaceae bacterium]
MSKTICLNCERTEQETPLLMLTFKDETKFICAQCLPTLIHKPHLLVEKLPGFDPSNIPPHEH